MKISSETEESASVSGDIKKDVEAQLKPLYVNFYRGSRSFELFDKYIPRFNDRNRKAANFIRNQTELVKVLGEGITASKIETCKAKQQNNFFAANGYLLLVELAGNMLIDQAILLLIGNGCEFHLEPDNDHHYTRHVSSPEDLDSPLLSLAVKLDFLKSNGLTFFSKMIDRNLRNKIAHMDFEFDQNGNFVVGRKKIDLAQKIEVFQDYFIAATEVFVKEARKAGLLKDNEKSGTDLVAVTDRKEK